MSFAIGSHTKMFVAAVLYQLQEEGLLSTSDPVSTYLPDEISLFPRPKEAATDQGAANWSYATIGYDMLGMIIEQVTGEPWQEAVRKRILEPLRTERTALIDGVAPAEMGLPSSYFVSPFSVDTSGWNYSQGDAAGNGVSTAEDLATFVRAYHSGQLFKDQATLEKVVTPAAPGFEAFTDGFTYLHGGFDKKGFLGHGGGTPGFASDAGYDPERDTTIVVWTNGSESYGGQGVIEVAHALGLTPSMDEIAAEIEAAS